MVKVAATAFHAVDRGSNPLGDANYENKLLREIVGLFSLVGRFVSFTGLELEPVSLIDWQFFYQAIIRTAAISPNLLRHL